MKFAFIFKAVFFLAIVGVIFLGGIAVGAGFGTGTAQEKQRDTLETCLERGPVTDTEDLDGCLADEDGDQ